MTRSLHYLIATNIVDGNWDGRLNFAHDNYALSELFFWKRNLKKLNSRSLLPCEAHSLTGYSDASDFALGAILKDLKDQGKSHVCRVSFSEDEILESSTSRELKAILLALRSFRTILSGHKVKWYCDNQGACHIFKKRSMKPDFQDLALDLYIECFRNRITVDIGWIPRIMNKEADTISKIIDYDDWETTEFLFKVLDRMWGPHTFDRLADSSNAKLKKFNSKFWCPDTAAVDAFSQDWSKDNNYSVPPIHLIAKVIDHSIITKSVGTLIVPWWPSAPFWPLLIGTLRNRNGNGDGTVRMM